MNNFKKVIIFIAILASTVLSFSTQSLHAGVFSGAVAAAGGYHTCALTGEGVRCWGENKHGQTDVPTDLVYPTQITAGYWHTCAITDNGVRCWGHSRDGQTNVPTDLVNPTQIAAGKNYTCALTDEGVRCWGDNYFGKTDVPTGLVNPTQITAGEHHTCAITIEGVRCWGNNRSGQTKVPKDLINPTQITAGENHTCAITIEGVRCWGDNTYGQTDVPTDLVNPTQITAGYWHTCAITDEGVRCWGDNTYGQTDVPNLTFSPRTLFDGIECLKEFLYSEKHIFLDAVNQHTDTEGTVNEAFLFFALKPFFAAIDSSWAVKELHPDLPIMISYYHETFQTSSLSDFNRTPEYLTYSLNILSRALTSTRAMLTLDTQREVSEVLLPALAEKLAKTELTPRDAEDIAALFTSHQLALTEMQSTPRLVPFAKMIEELINWLRGS